MNRSQGRMAPAWLGALGLLVVACGAEGDRPGFVVMPEMYERVNYGAFDPNEVTEDGKTLIRPPEGTVPYGGSAFLYGPGGDEAVRAGQELFLPLEPTAENLARGRRAYQAACSVCHGNGGRGDGPIIGRFPNPPSLLAERAMSMPDGHILHIIVHGQGIMAPHGAHVRGDDRWRVVMYLRTLQGLDPAGGVGEPEPADEDSALPEEAAEAYLDDVEDPAEASETDAPEDVDAAEGADGPEDADALEDTAPTEAAPSDEEDAE
jgi:mono/diheme cytochrome c family protein